MPPFPISRLLLFVPRLTHLSKNGLLEPDDSSSSSTVLTKILSSRLYSQTGKLQKEDDNDTLKFLGLVESIHGFANNPALFESGGEERLTEDAGDQAPPPSEDIVTTLRNDAVIHIFALTPELSICILYRNSLPSSIPSLIASNVRDFFASNQALQAASETIDEYISSHSAAAFYGVVRKIGRIEAERLWRERNNRLNSGRLSDLTIEEDAVEDDLGPDAIGDAGDAGDGVDNASVGGRRRASSSRSLAAMNDELVTLSTTLAELTASSPMAQVRTSTGTPLTVLIALINQCVGQTFFPPDNAPPPPPGTPMPPNVLSLPTLPPLATILTLPGEDSNAIADDSGSAKCSWFHKSTYLLSNFQIDRTAVTEIFAALPPSPTLGWYADPSPKTVRSKQVESVNVPPFGKLCYVLHDVPEPMAHFAYQVNDYTIIFSLAFPLQVDLGGVLRRVATSIDGNPPAAHNPARRTVPHSVNIRYSNAADCNTAETAGAPSVTACHELAQYRQVFHGIGDGSVYARSSGERSVVVVMRGGGVRWVEREIVGGVCI